MPAGSSLRAQKIRNVRLHKRHMTVTIGELAQMLEMDLALFADRIGFRRRLQRALDDAFHQGKQKASIS